jgi:acylphosphatase
MADQCVLRARVTGRVQGVWFRGWTEREARRRGLKGWVRNEADGSVTMLLSGPRGDVEDMVAALHDGPPAARVDRVETAEVGEAAPEGFSVRR